MKETDISYVYAQLGTFWNIARQGSSSDLLSGFVDMILCFLRIVLQDKNKDIGGVIWPVYVQLPLFSVPINCPAGLQAVSQSQSGQSASCRRNLFKIRDDAHHTPHSLFNVRMVPEIMRWYFLQFFLRSMDIIERRPLFLAWMTNHLWDIFWHWKGWLRMRMKGAGVMLILQWIVISHAEVAYVPSG